MPKALYKYRSFDREGWSLKNLESDTVWLSLQKISMTLMIAHFALILMV